jgi:hypothetical protein
MILGKKNSALREVKPHEKKEKRKKKKKINAAGR